MITLSAPDALFEYALASTAAHVVNKAFVEKSGDKYGKPEVGSIGTGPFKFAEWKTGDYQRLVRNDGYWNKANGGPYLDEITIKILPEPTTRVAGLQTGEIDYVITNVPSDQYATVQAIDNVSLTFVPSYYGEWITFNTQKAPFDNVKVRQALNYAFDKKGLRSSATARTRSTRRPRSSTRPCGRSRRTPGRRPGTRSRPTTRTSRRRRQLLAESGVADQLNGDDLVLRVHAVRQGLGRVVHRRHGQAGHPDQGPQGHLPGERRAPVRPAR